MDDRADWHEGIPAEYRRQVVTGDARELAARIPAESVDLVLADPVYDRIEDYEWLAGEAARVLKLGGNCLAQTAHYYLPEVLGVMARSLDYVWLVVEKHAGGPASFFKRRILCSYKPWVWFSKGPRAGGWIFDWLLDSGRDKTFHKWGDPAGAMLKSVIDRLVPLDGVIWDPFAGGGPIPEAAHVLGRGWIAPELDPEKAEIARARLRSIPDPLFVTDPHCQVRMEV